MAKLSEWKQRDCMWSLDITNHAGVSFPLPGLPAKILSIAWLRPVPTVTCHPSMGTQISWQPSGKYSAAHCGVQSKPNPRKRQPPSPLRSSGLPEHRLSQRPTLRCHATHLYPPLKTQWKNTNSSWIPVSTSFFLIYCFPVAFLFFKSFGF